MGSGLEQEVAPPAVPVQCEPRTGGDLRSQHPCAGCRVVMGTPEAGRQRHVRTGESLPQGRSQPVAQQGDGDAPRVLVGVGGRPRVAGQEHETGGSGRTDQSAPALPDRGDPGIRGAGVPGQHGRGRRQGGGVEATLGGVAVPPAVGGDRAVDRTVAGPDESCVLGLGVHGRPEGRRGLRPGGPLGFQGGLEVGNIGKVHRLVQALPGLRCPWPVALNRMEQARVGLETAGHHRQDAAQRLGLHQAQPLTPAGVGHPVESC